MATVEAPPASQRLLRHAAGVASAGPASTIGVVCWTALASCLGAIPILVLVRPKGPHFPTAHQLVGRVVVGVGVAALALLVVRWFWRWGDRRTGAALDRESEVDPTADAEVRRDTFSACILATAALLPLLLIPVYLLAQSTTPAREQAVLYPFVDRRWLVATFLIATLGLFALITAMGRVVAAARPTPESWTAWLRAAVAPQQRTTPADAAALPLQGKRSLGPVMLKLAIAAAVAWYFFGPPWGLSHNLRPIDAHETFQLGALQAITDGATPYLGAASSQYGPGAQLISSLFLHHISSNSVLGFRESYALLNWIAATLFFAAVVSRLRLLPAISVIGLSVLLFPTLQEFGFSGLPFTANGTLDGFFGWFDALRYIGVIAAVMFVPVVVRMRSRRLPAAVALGAFWGGMCYVAQENLGAGVAGLAAISALLVLTRSAELGSMLRILGGLAAGFALIWAPILLYYAGKGEVGRFLWTYFLVPSAVSRGYSNAPYQQGFGSDWGPMFYVLPFLLFVVGIVSLLRVGPLRIATRWSSERTILISAVVACAACYSGALLRSDESHLINTTLAVPLLLVAVIAYLPRVVAPGASRRATTSVSLGLAGCLLLLIPLSEYARLPDRLVSPASARIAMIGRGSVPGNTLAATRIGAGLAIAPTCCTATLFSSPIPMQSFISFLNQLHAVIGTRRTYVTWGLGSGVPGLLYFGATLRPAPLYVEPGTLLVDQQIQQRFLRYFHDHVSQTRAFVTNDLAPSPELSMFTTAYPAHRTVTLVLGGRPVYVLLAP